MVTSAGIVPAQRAGEEPPGGRQVPPLRQQYVDDLAVLVDRPVEVGPLAGDLDVCFVGEPPVAGSVPTGPGGLDEPWG